MLELILGTYGLLCWLLFKKWKIIPTNTYTVFTAILIGVVFLASLGVMLIRYQPASSDGRLYVVTTPILPEVRGIVTEVMVEANKPLKQGDPLFQINPIPYRLEVERLEASLAASSTDTSQLEQRAAGANAGVSQAMAQVVRFRSELKLANLEFKRASDLIAQKTISQQQYDRYKQQADQAKAQLSQAEAAHAQALTQERDVRLELDSRTDGMTPATRQTLAALGKARFDLEQTTVRAPANGYVTQLMLRPGQMATNLPLAPVMIFIGDEPPSLVASFPQNVVALLQPGQEAEVAFKAYPGRIFKAKVQKVLPVASEGQMSASGTLRTTVSARAQARIPVLFSYEGDIADLQLPGGAAATVAVYTDHFKPLGIARKIVLRIKSWENFLFLP